MKVCLFSLPGIPAGKHNIKDARLDQVDKITKSKKKTYIQIELVKDEGALDSDVLILLKKNQMDLILLDLDFTEKRLEKAVEPFERGMFLKFKDTLEKEELLSSLSLSEEEKKITLGYGLVTLKPVVLVEEEELDDVSGVIFKAFQKSGFISFFTTGEKETRAWLIKKGATAYEASGQIHSDIQKGFIRAEIISFNDFVQYNGEVGAKQAGRMRLEQKDYIMQDCDLANFRFNK
ncbi:MAG: DUF933 domain-containing protein [Candidatus Omnitrophota bacterium]